MWNFIKRLFGGKEDVAQTYEAPYKVETPPVLTPEPTPEPVKIDSEPAAPVAPAVVKKPRAPRKPPVAPVVVPTVRGNRKSTAPVITGKKPTTPKSK